MYSAQDCSFYTVSTLHFLLLLHALCTWLWDPDLLSRVVGGSFACWSLGIWQEQLSSCWMIPGLSFLKSSLEMEGLLWFCRKISTSCLAEKQACIKKTHSYKPQPSIRYNSHFRGQNYTGLRQLHGDVIASCYLCIVYRSLSSKVHLKIILSIISYFWHIYFLSGK